MNKKVLSILLAISMVLSMASVSFGATSDAGLERAWTTDQNYTLADPAPWNLSELKQVVDVSDPRSVAAYWVWSVNRLTTSYDDGMKMMKYLYADIDPYTSNYVEGGMSGRAGWDTFFTDRLKDSKYSWLPRAYFNGASKSNGFVPPRPLSVKLYYKAEDTQTLNNQSYSSMGRLNIVYYVKSNAAGNRNTMILSKFKGSNRWYVTNSAASNVLFYEQSGSLSSAELSLAKTAKGDTTTSREHSAYYGGSYSDNDNRNNPPFNDNNPYGDDDNNIAGTIDRNNGDDDNDYDPYGPYDPYGDDDPYDPYDPYGDDDPYDPYGPYNPYGDDDPYDPYDPYGYDDPTVGPDDGDHDGDYIFDPDGVENTFIDVNRVDYYYEPIQWAYNNNVTAGTSYNTFGPYDNCTRGQVVTFLWRAAGCPEPNSLYNPFEDVNPYDYYHKAVLWAVQEGITSGTSGETFSPNQPCSSAHIITFLYRANGGDNGWNGEAKLWAQEYDLTRDTGLSISPNELCPRGAVVTFLYRNFISLMVA